MRALRRRGILMVAALMLSVLILILGMAYLGQRGDQMRAAYRDQEALRALQIAMAGLEDARVKLDHDPRFPPVGLGDQKVFAYSEPVLDLDGVTRLGTYEVTLDASWMQAPYGLLRVESLGRVEDAAGVRAQRKVLGEFDLSEVVRGTLNPNPRSFDLVNFQDLGAF